MPIRYITFWSFQALLLYTLNYWTLWWFVLDPIWWFVRRESTSLISEYQGSFGLPSVCDKCIRSTYVGSLSLTDLLLWRICLQGKSIAALLLFRYFLFRILKKAKHQFIQNQKSEPLPFVFLLLLSACPPMWRLWPALQMWSSWGGGGGSH